MAKRAMEVRNGYILRNGLDQKYLKERERIHIENLTDHRLEEMEDEFIEARIRDLQSIETLLL
jgi:hypothetical protein